MQEPTIKNIKLGVFVVAGLLLMILLLYLIGINRNIFGSHYELRTSFSQVNGLEVGNNVRFAGINAGTVDDIEMIDDSTIEVTMLMNKKFKGIIRTNAEASISTDGLVGNKIINIIAGKGMATAANSGDFIFSKKNTDTEEMIRTLSVSNENVRKITDSLLLLISAVKNSGNMKYFTEDISIQHHFSNTLKMLDNSMTHFQKSSMQIQDIIQDIEAGKGNIGQLIKDTLVVSDLKHTIQTIHQSAENLSALIDTTEKTIILVKQKLNANNNTIGKFLNDTTMSNDMAEAIRHINLSAKHFDENMLALQQTIFFRKYFRKQKAILK